jgi:hypothetical protein
MRLLSDAYGARWKAAFGQSELRYNERIWTPAAEYHSPDDALFGLFDKKDGSTFMVRIEQLEAAADLPEEALEQSLLEPYLHPRFRATILARRSLDVSMRQFSGFVLSFENSKFGSQYLQLAFHRDSETATVVLLAWPRTMNEASPELPVKHRSLLQGLSLASQ